MKLPTRDEAQRLLDMRPRPEWGYWIWALATGRANGILMTAQEWQDSLELIPMFMCWSIPAKRWMMRGHSAFQGCNSRCGEVLILDAVLEGSE